MILVTQSCLTLCNPMDCSLLGSSVHGDSLGKNTGVGCHVFLQGSFPSQGSNPGVPHSLPSEPPGKPMYLYVCVCVCVCMYVYVYIYMYVCIYIHVCICITESLCYIVK